MPLDISRIQALCFDIDGTLSDTDDHFVHRLVKALSPIKFLFPNRDPQPFARKVVMATETPGTFLYGIPDRLSIDRQIAKITDFLYQSGLGKNKRPFLIIPGVSDALHILAKHYPMSVVSARGERSTHIFLEQFNLENLFKCIVTSQTCDRTKPSPDPILWAAKQLGVPPDSCLMIGDTTVDIIASKSANAQAIGVLCGFGEREELQKAGADLIIKTTSQLPEVLLRLDK